MSISGYLIRGAPIAMPLVVVCSTLAGLATRLDAFPDVDNLIFIVYATTLSGIALACMLVGILFLVTDCLRNRYRPYILIAMLVITFALMVFGYIYGRGLDF